MLYSVAVQVHGGPNFVWQFRVASASEATAMARRWIRMEAWDEDHAVTLKCWPAHTAVPAWGAV